MKKLITYLLIFLLAISSKSFAQKPPEDVKPLSKGVYSSKGKKEFRKEEKEKRHVFKLWKKVFEKKKPKGSVATVRSNPHLGKEIKAEKRARHMIRRREIKELKRSERKIRTKRTLHLRHRRKIRDGEK